MSILILFVIGFGHLIPSFVSLRWLSSLIEREGFVFSPHFSGRTALFAIAASNHNVNTSNVVLLPDYICNVVYLAFKKAGWTVVSYPSSYKMDYDWIKLQEQIEIHSPRILLGASIYGSSGLIDVVLDEIKSKYLIEKDVKVVLDFAQDISLINKLSPKLNSFVEVIVSFNDKSFIGMMGGGILSQKAYPSCKKMPKNLSWILYKTFVRKIICNLFSPFRNSFIKKDSSLYDFSYCQEFPYKFDLYAIQKLQVLLGIVGLYFLPYYHLRKKRFLKKHPKFINTPHINTTSYVAYEDSQCCQYVTNSKKKSYAKPDNLKESYMEKIFVVHNKGFFDS